MNIVLIAHYYPPINSSGAKRVEALSKYFVSFGHTVSVITPTKTAADGEFTEKIPDGVNLIELSWSGREISSYHDGGSFEPMYSGRPSMKRRIKDAVMAMLGQIPDPRLPFSLAFLMPWFSPRAISALKAADVVIGTTPPWPMVLAALLCKYRFGKPCILDYRDHFSECHEMPGGKFAKWLEKIIDRWMVSRANQVVCISDPMSGYYKQLAQRVETILNGYDSERLEEARLTSKSDDLKRSTVTIRYMGIVSPGRVPHNILKSLVTLKKNRPDLFEKLSFEYYGNAAVLADVLDSKYQSVQSAFKFFPSVSYRDSLIKITEADYLLFSETSLQNTLSAQGILTTKLFEYIGSGRPVLGDISTNTLAGSLLSRSGTNHVVGDDQELFLNAFLSPSFYVRKSDEISDICYSLSRKAQAVSYENLIKNILKN